MPSNAIAMQSPKVHRLILSGGVFEDRSYNGLTKSPSPPDLTFM